MELITHLKLTVIVATICSFTLTGRGQTPPVEEKSPIGIGDVQIQEAKLPGSSLAWSKILISFNSAEKWADGIVFNVQALLDEKGQQRVVSGIVRYGNVPVGPHVAVFYISPKATARFGAPIAIKVAAFYKDKEAGTKDWSNGKASVPQDWNSLNVYPGILLNVMQTPWLMIDYEKSPDVIPVQ